MVEALVLALRKSIENLLMSALVTVDTVGQEAKQSAETTAFAGHLKEFNSLCDQLQQHFYRLSLRTTKNAKIAEIVNSQLYSALAATGKSSTIAPPLIPGGQPKSNDVGVLLATVDTFRKRTDEIQKCISDFSKVLKEEDDMVT
mmetsp:Transcript_74/g.133  ORF Transcript_74/g.133 Transcript_74/m.133 type:complete len:144 (+) Transcript_74:58-489(+)|eukprot:CAMPEP_0184657396 /NCGR_PEP_ID=MMETSP0308-20130426/19234_1 /TAXON_ID=38269 /ORGANISM="Gloeochaete witrockiana, Strain SAG 46.84" /LENGTH=143 /DNA_ID=CAMNT_0027095175 /DNA_START=21 /DNA_END=452 /DNA_ORIENTATION=+